MSPDNRRGEEYCGLGGGHGALPEMLQQPAHATEAETEKICIRENRNRRKFSPHDGKINFLTVNSVHVEKCVHLK